MLKHSLYLIFILLSLNANSQIGKYCWEEFMTTACLTLEKDLTFTFFQAVCVGKIIGRGEYQIKDQMLHLKYDTLSSFNIRKIDSDDEVIELHINVLDHFSKIKLDHFYLHEVNFEQDRVDLKFTGSIAKSTISTKFEDIVWYEITWPGYSTQSLLIEEPGIYQINVELEKGIDGKIEYLQGEDSYGIKLIDQNNLILKLDKDYDMTFKKVNN